MENKVCSSRSRKTYLLGVSNIILISFLALSCLLFIQSSAFAAKPTKDAASVGGISGVLQFCEGNPRGIVIYITGTSFSAKSGPSGDFSLRNIPTGSYQLIATMNSQQIGLLNNVPVVANQTTNVGTWRVCWDMDHDGFNAYVDCNDNANRIYPGAVEVCDGIDNDCNGEVDEGQPCGPGMACVNGYCQSIAAENPYSCTVDTECLGGYYCSEDHKCLPKKSLGDPCRRDFECLYGPCSAQDGVCCDSPCLGTCMSCLGENTGMTTGECGFTRAGIDPDNDCGPEQCCDGGGLCQPN